MTAVEAIGIAAAAAGVQKYSPLRRLTVTLYVTVAQCDIHSDLLCTFSYAYVHVQVHVNV